jgi:hypothetical protein
MLLLSYPLLGLTEAESCKRINAFLNIVQIEGNSAVRKKKDQKGGRHEYL